MNIDLYSLAIGLTIGIFFALGFALLQANYFRRKQSGMRQVKAAPEKVEIHIVVEMLTLNTQGLPAMAELMTIPEGITWNQIREIGIRMVKNGYNFSYALAGRGAGNPVSRSQLDNLRPLFIDYGILKEKIPGASRVEVVVTPPGRAFFRKCSELPPYTEEDLIANARKARAAQTHTNAGSELHSVE